MYEVILAPTDGSDGARKAVDRAIELATIFNADLHLLYVVDTEQFSADKPEAEVDSMLEDIEREGEDVLADLEERARTGPVNYLETHLDRGVAHERILACAEDVDTELIVMGTHGESGSGSVHLGHIAHEVARRADQPLFLV